MSCKLKSAWLVWLGKAPGFIEICGSVHTWIIHRYLYFCLPPCSMHKWENSSTFLPSFACERIFPIRALILFGHIVPSRQQVLVFQNERKTRKRAHNKRKKGANLRKKVQKGANSKKGTNSTLVRSTHSIPRAFFSQTSTFSVDVVAGAEIFRSTILGSVG